VEDDKDDNEDYDDDAESGISSFFRMIFYPVQLAMSRIFDGFTSQSDDQSVEKPKYPKYPSYTLYHSAHSNNDLAMEEDSEEEEEDDSDHRVDEGKKTQCRIGF